MKAALALALLTGIAAAPMHGQGSFQVPTNLYRLNGTGLKGASTLSPPAFGHPEDYRYEGAIAGAIVMGGSLAYLAHGLCEANCGTETVEVGMAGAVFGGLFGLLIGGMITKD